MNKEKSHMQGYVFLKFFFSLFLALEAKQKKGDRKNHTVRQIQRIQPRITVSWNRTNS